MNNNIENLNVRNFSFLNMFYNPKNLKLTNPIENYEKTTQFKKLPLLYANPKWDNDKKKLVFNSFDYELELTKKKQYLKNF